MNKILAVVIIVVSSTLIGGAYGVLHDQVSYSISEEYFTKFKFIQFGLSQMGENVGTESTPEIKLQNPRLGVVIVGWSATWWVGLIIGISFATIGLFHSSYSRAIKFGFIALAFCMGIAVVFAGIGLIRGFAFMDSIPKNWFVPGNILEPGKYIAVGSMHNFSYLGGLVGLVAGSIYSISRAIKAKRHS